MLGMTLSEVVGLQGLSKVTDADFFARFTYKVLCQHHLLQQKYCTCQSFV